MQFELKSIILPKSPDSMTVSNELRYGYRKHLTETYHLFPYFGAHKTLFLDTLHSTDFTESAIMHGRSFGGNKNHL